MIRSTRIHFLLASALLAMLTAAALAQSPSVAQRVQKAVERMTGGRLADVYAVSDELVDLGDDAVAELQNQVRKIKDPHALLGCLKALAELDAQDDAGSKLLELAGPDHDAEVRTAALFQMRALPPARDAAAKLSDYLDDCFDPTVKVALAQALRRLGDGAQSKKAIAALKELLKSDDRDVRIRGALALGEIGEFDAAGPILHQIAQEPTLEGQVARNLVEVEDLKRYYERREERLVAEGSAQAKDDPLDLIRELISWVQKEHIHGDQYLNADGSPNREAVEKLLTAAAKGMLEYLDEHSTYFSPTEYEKWLLDLNRDYGGIGAYVDTINGRFTILRPIYSGPAFKVGLRSDDWVTEVDGWKTLNEPQQAVIDHLKGKPGTTVKIKVVRPGWQEARDFDIVRDTIKIPSVRYELFPGGIGYVEVVTFADGTVREELRPALEELQAMGAAGIILDLRYNHGGYLSEAVDMCGEFLGPDKVVVECRTRHQKMGEGVTHKTRTRRAREMPLVVLINHASASASEIVSGTLKHYGRAEIVGKKSFGKGSVQNPFQLEARAPEAFADKNRNGRFDPNEEFDDANGNDKYDVGSMFKLTTQLYYLPSGESIHTDYDADGRRLHEGGVKPDVEVDFDSVEAFKQEELYKLLEMDKDRQNVFTRYVKKHYPGNEKLFVELAEGDGGSTERYPDFDSFYAGLETKLDQSEVRRWLRLYVRYEVADQREKEFPGNDFLGDFQEDSQLQRAILELLEKLGKDAHDIAQYRGFADAAAKQDKLLAERKAKDEPGASDKKTEGN